MFDGNRVVHVSIEQDLLAIGYHDGAVVLGQKLARLDSDDRALLLETFERLVERLAKS